MKCISLILLLSLAACAGNTVSKKEELPQAPRQVKEEPPVEMVNAEIDLDKIKTISDVVGVLKLFQPNPLPIHIKKDSVADNKIFDGVKHLQKDKIVPPKKGQ